ncbi:MAG: Mur ligase family protein, partial [Cellvibrionaceae bacterium]|nr:Mur ligase family protein [Cellvibrionaceae bacterium]
EIAYLSALAKPSVVMVNNVMAAHLQGFGSLDGVALAKGEIYRGLAEGAKAVINQDQDYAERWASGLSESQILRFSLNEAAADLYADQLQLQDDGCYQFQLHTPAGETQVQLSIPGRHNVANGLAAASCAFACGIGLDLIAAGLANADSASGRLQLKQHCSGATIIDDSYNANPGSVKAAIDMLAERDGEKFLVLGDMGELGEKARSHHADVGAYAQGKGLSGLFCVGELSKAAAAKSDCGKHFGDKTELVAALRPLLGKDTTVLVKGSRSAAMETVVAALLAEEQGEHNNNKAEPSC